MKRFLFTLILALTCLALSAAVKDPLKSKDKAFFSFRASGGNTNYLAETPYY